MLYAKWNNITYHVACGKLKMDAINLKATIKELWLMSEKEETKDLYAENYKTLMKEIKDDTNRWRGIPCCWI